MKCTATTKSGLPCRAAAGLSGLCFFHANPGEAKKLGQVGGWKNRRPLPVDIVVPENLKVADLPKINAQAMRRVLSGDLEPQVANSLVQMSKLQIRIFEGLECEARIKALENQIAKLRARPTPAAFEREEEAQPVSEATRKAENDDEHRANPSPDESETISTSVVAEQANQKFEEVGTQEIASDQALDENDSEKT